MNAGASGSDALISAAPEQLSSKLGSEVVILNLTSGVYYGLDPVGARVWELIQESRTFSAICDQIVSEFDVDRERAEHDISDLLKQMQDEGLIRLGNQ